MNIHFFSDVSFVDLAIQRFEKYYPGQNRYFVVTQGRFRKKYRFIKSDQVVQLHYASIHRLTRLLPSLTENDNLVIHQLTPFKSILALKLLKKVDLTTYWLFYGSGLYNLLARSNQYQLLDDGTPRELNGTLNTWILNLRDWFLSLLFQQRHDNALEAFIARFDYFCFWNPYDYKLLKHHFKTPATFKFFRYYDVNLHGLPDLGKSENEASPILLVNNSASRTGNHLTILKRLHQIDQDKQLEKVYVPLSYGEPDVRQDVVDYASHHLNYCFQPIMDFIPKVEYISLLRRVQVGIFGHRRQEAGNNIYILLALGVKIFLRSQNNLLRYLRDQGYHVFEFEADLHSIQDLDPLPIGQQEHNRRLALAEFSPDRIDQVYNSLFD